MSRFIFIIAFLLVLSVGCTEEEVTSREYPRVHTLEIMPAGNTSLKLKGEIFFSSVPIADHGFVWTEVGFPTVTNGAKFSLGPKEGAGIFETTAAATLKSGKTYAARAYAQSAEYTVYGELFEFIAP
ncbi:MAG TPA: hypothetical protein VFZ52_01235 [Chryseolinea sp.]